MSDRSPSEKVAFVYTGANPFESQPLINSRYNLLIGPSVANEHRGLPGPLSGGDFRPCDKFGPASNRVEKHRKSGVNIYKGTIEYYP